MRKIWPAVQKAAEWNFGMAAKFGTIRSDILINTFDGIYREGDVCTYTSVLYVAALAALEELAGAFGNATLARRCAQGRLVRCARKQTDASHMLLPWS